MVLSSLEDDNVSICLLTLRKAKSEKRKAKREQRLSLHCHSRRCDALGQELSDAADLRSHPTQLFFDALVAPVNVVDAVDDGLAIGTSAANTSDAEARRSLACTAAPLSGVRPRTTARLPSILTFAPMRTSSWACMKRFSKMFSVTMLVPSACVASAMYCACMSVGKPGYSSVFTSALLNGPLPITRTESPLVLTCTPHSSSFCSSALRCWGSQPETSRSPPVSAPATM